MELTEDSNVWFTKVYVGIADREVKPVAKRRGEAVVHTWGYCSSPRMKASCFHLL